ncbi:MAG: hypothetical protein EHM85_15395 [Desulfobacteraceae bacterium]|nr:MAG: hypothetical protein EHM85_15395 [Desulfobacteraceae bacterium]
MIKVGHKIVNKMRKELCFTSLRPRNRQSEQNDTDEPPSPFLLFQTFSSPALITAELPVFLLPKNSFSGKIKPLPFPANRFKRELAKRADDSFETGGFIIRDKRGRIKTIIFKQKRSM